jgi:hypothetical protein
LDDLAALQKKYQWPHGPLGKRNRAAFEEEGAPMPATPFHPGIERFVWQQVHDLKDLNPAEWLQPGDIFLGYQAKLESNLQGCIPDECEGEVQQVILRQMQRTVQKCFYKNSGSLLAVLIKQTRNIPINQLAARTMFLELYREICSAWSVHPFSTLALASFTNAELALPLICVTNNSLVHRLGEDLGLLSRALLHQNETSFIHEELEEAKDTIRRQTEELFVLKRNEEIHRQQELATLVSLNTVTKELKEAECVIADLKADLTGKSVLALADVDLLDSD